MCYKGCPLSKFIRDSLIIIIMLGIAAEILFAICKKIEAESPALSFFKKGKRPKDYYPFLSILHIGRTQALQYTREN